MESRTVPMPFPPAGEGAWGIIQLPWPMTEEQWQALEAYMAVLKVGFVRQGGKANPPSAGVEPPGPGGAMGQAPATPSTIAHADDSEPSR
jgi:hypothetical protein